MKRSNRIGLFLTGRKVNRRRFYLALVLLLVIIAAGLRLWQLSILPPGLWYDEAYNAMDSLWMLKTRSPQLFFNGNSGREPLYHYLATISFGLFGATPYTLRLVSVFIGLLTIPLMYRWLSSFFADEPGRYWLAIFGAAGLSLSLWHLGMSRTGYRAVLLPLFVILVIYLFWLAWRHRSLLGFIGAGAALGLSQYTYTSARLLPLLFGIFFITWLILGKKPVSATPLDRFTPLTTKKQSGSWLQSVQVVNGRLQLLSEAQLLLFGILVMALISFIIFLPLGLFVWQHPTLFFSRSLHVSIFNQATQIGSTSIAAFLVTHLIETLRVFYDGAGDPNWRHTIVGTANFDWLTRIGFWIGLIISLRRLRRPPYLWLIVSLVVLWLPAFLSEINTLRLSGWLVPYYATMAIGLLAIARWAGRYLKWQADQANLVIFGLIFVISGGMTIYNYFIYWADEPEVYNRFRGQLTDLTRYLIDQSQTSDLLIPFHLYTHPASRFLLSPEFDEVSVQPPLRPKHSAILVDVPDMVDLPAQTTAQSYVWLTHDESGQGLAYLLPLNNLADIKALSPSAEAVPFYNPRTGRRFARLTPLADIEPFLSSINQQPAGQVDYTWGRQVALVGYQVQPDRVFPGQSPRLTLYWRNLIWQPFNYTIFVQLINGRGEPVGQWTDGYFSDEHRWRVGRLTPTQHHLWLSPEASPGPYLVRIGLFDIKTGQRLPVYGNNRQSLGDQVNLGLFYLAAGDADPRQPQVPLTAYLDEETGAQIEFLGYTLPPSTPGQNQKSLRVQLYWQTTERIERDYTIFVQLLDAQGQRVTGWDAQPLAGLYPTSFWQPGEVVVDEFELPLPDKLSPGNYRLVTGMYDFVSGQRLPAKGSNGQALPDDLIVLHQTYLQ